MLAILTVVPESADIDGSLQILRNNDIPEFRNPVCIENGLITSLKDGRVGIVLNSKSKTLGRNTSEINIEGAVISAFFIKIAGPIRYLF